MALQIATIIVLMLSLSINTVIVYEYRLARAERIRRREADISGAMYDAQTVRNARYVMSAIDTFPECFPCREAFERSLDKRADRYRLWP